MIKCNKCSGKCFVDFTFTGNKNYEVFCLLCGKRDFVGVAHPLYKTVHTYVSEVLVS